MEQDAYTGLSPVLYLCQMIEVECQLQYEGVVILRDSGIAATFLFSPCRTNNITRNSQMALKICQEYGSTIKIPPEELETLPGRSMESQPWEP